MKCKRKSSAETTSAEITILKTLVVQMRRKSANHLVDRITFVDRILRESVARMSITERFELAHSLGHVADALFSSGEVMAGRIAYNNPGN